MSAHIDCHQAAGLASGASQVGSPASVAGDAQGSDTSTRSVSPIDPTTQHVTAGTASDLLPVQQVETHRNGEETEDVLQLVPPIEPSATHIVVEHTRDGTVKTHVYARKGDSHPSDLHDTILGRSAIPHGDPTWSSHASITQQVVQVEPGVIANSTATPVAAKESFDPEVLTATITAVVTTSANETESAISTALAVHTDTITQAMTATAQETVHQFHAMRQDALLEGEARGAILVSEATAKEIDRQISEQLVPRLDEIAQYVSSTAAAVERAAQLGPPLNPSPTTVPVAHAQESETTDFISGARDIGHPAIDGSSPSSSSAPPGMAAPSTSNDPSRSGPASTASSVATTSTGPIHTILDNASDAGPANDEHVNDNIDNHRADTAGILDKLTGLEDKIGTIYRVVVDGEIPDSEPQLAVDNVPEVSVLGPSWASLTADEVEARGRFEALRRESLAFPGQLQEVNANMVSLLHALERKAETVATPQPGVAEAEGSAVGTVPDKEEIEEAPEPELPQDAPRSDDEPEKQVEIKEEMDESQARNEPAPDEEDVRWKEFVQGSHEKQHSLLELLSDKVDGSKDMNRLAMKTFWVFMRLLFHHTKDMRSVVDQIQQDLETRSTSDNTSHSSVSAVLNSIQDSLYSLSCQLPVALSDSVAEIQRAVNQGIVAIQASQAAAVEPTSPQAEVAATEAAVAVVDESVATDATDPSDVQGSGTQRARNRSLPIPGTDITRASVGDLSDDNESVRSAPVSDASTDTADSETADTSDPGPLPVSVDNHAPRAEFAGMEQLLAIIEGLRATISDMTEKYSELCLSLGRRTNPVERTAAAITAEPVSGVDQPAPEEVLEELPAAQAQAQAQNVSDPGEAATFNPPPSLPRRPAEGYGSIPRSIEPEASEAASVAETAAPVTRAIEHAETPMEEMAAFSVGSPPLSILASNPPAVPATFQELQQMSSVLDHLVRLISRTGSELMAGQKFLHNELQAEILKVIHTIHPPSAPETPEQKLEREAKEEKARHAAEKESQRKAEEHERSQEHLSMIPNLMASLEGVNSHLGYKLQELQDDFGANSTQLGDKTTAVHRDVEKLLTGSIEDSGTLNTVHTLLEELVAKKSSNLAENAKDIVNQVRAVLDSTMTQHQETILQLLEQLHLKHDERCEVIDNWHKKHDARNEGFDKWHMSQDERYLGFDHWRLLYNDECASQDQWRNQMDDRHAEYGAWQKKSLELLQKIEQAPKCRCHAALEHGSALTPMPSNEPKVDIEDIQASAPSQAKTRETGVHSEVESLGNDSEGTAGDTPKSHDGDPEVDNQHQSREISVTAGSDCSATASSGSPTPNGLRRARELYKLVRSVLDEYAPGYLDGSNVAPSSVSLRSEPECSVHERDAPSPVHSDAPSSKRSSAKDEQPMIVDDPFGLLKTPAPSETGDDIVSERKSYQELYDMLRPYFPPREQGVPKEAFGGALDHAMPAATVADATTTTTADEATRQLAELQERHDAVVAENEGLKTQTDNLFTMAMDRNREIDTLMSDKIRLEQNLNQRKDDLDRQKDKYRKAKRTIERLYRSGLGLEELPLSDSPGSQYHDGASARLSSASADAEGEEDASIVYPRMSHSSLLREASEQLRQTVDEFKEQHSILRAEISALERQKAQLQREVVEMTSQNILSSATAAAAATAVRTPSNLSSCSRRSHHTGVSTSGERESLLGVEDRDVEGYVQVEEVEGEADVESNRSIKKGGSRGRSRPVSMVGGSNVGSGGGSEAGGSATGSTSTRHAAKRSMYQRSRSTTGIGSSSSSKRHLRPEMRVPQLEADIKICKDGAMSETLLSSRTILADDHINKIRPSNLAGQASEKQRKKEVEEGDEEEEGELEVWSLMCDFKVNMVHYP